MTDQRPFASECTKYIIAFDLVHTIVRASGQGCTVTGFEHPVGSSGFADDTILHGFADYTILHTDGPDSIPAM